MRAQRLPASAGWRWLVAGYATFRRNPAMLVLIVVLYWITVIFANVVPILGSIAASVAMPALSVGVMNACRELEEGRAPAPGMLYSGFRTELRTLLILGALYIVLTVSVLAVSALIDGGVLMRFLLTGKPPSKEALGGVGGILAPLTVGLLLAPLLMAYWFAPMLAAWHRLSAVKALFFSLAASWMNWRAFVVYGLALIGLAVVLPSLVMVICAAIFPQAVQILSAVISVPLLIVLMPVVFASFYASYRTVFVLEEDA